MLDYDWGEQTSVMLSGEEQNQENDQNRHFFHDPFVNNTPQTYTHDQNTISLMNTHHHFPTTHQQQNQQFFHTPNNTHHHHHHLTNTLFDPRAYETSYTHPPTQGTLPTMQHGFMVVPKSEPQFVGTGIDHFGGGSSSSRIGLNLGGRTYFSSSEDDFVNRLYRRTRAVEAAGSVNTPRCQAEGCNADLTHAKHYHRRHKVCEFHSKAATVIAAGLTQRFCQQCSRFHLLSEFDNGKRSCRKRLADHNRRRRKNQQANLENSNKSQVESTRNSSSDSLARSPPDSGAHSSSVTVAISPPTISLDCFRQRP